MHTSLRLLLIFLIVSGNKTFAQTSKAYINHVAIYVMDVKKSGDFYMNIIGLDSVPEPFHDGKHIWLRIGPGSTMHIIEGANAKKEYYKNNHTCFTVPSVQAFTGILQKHSILWEDVNGKKMGITNRVDGVKQIWLQDPDGYWLEINDARD